MLPNRPQPDGRSLARRKRSAFKQGGALVLFGDRILKRLIQHGFAAWYEAIGNGLQPSQLRFLNALGPTPLFLETLSRACDIVARSCRVGFFQAGDLVSLDGTYVLKLRYGKRTAKPVAADFMRVGDADTVGDPPF